MFTAIAAAASQLTFLQENFTVRQVQAAQPCAMGIDWPAENKQPLISIQVECVADRLRRPGLAQLHQ